MMSIYVIMAAFVAHVKADPPSDTKDNLVDVVNNNKFKLDHPDKELKNNPLYSCPEDQQRKNWKPNVVSVEVLENVDSCAEPCGSFVERIKRFLYRVYKKIMEKTDEASDCLFPSLEMCNKYKTEIETSMELYEVDGWSLVDSKLSPELQYLNTKSIDIKLVLFPEFCELLKLYKLLMTKYRDNLYISNTTDKHDSEADKLKKQKYRIYFDTELDFVVVSTDKTDGRQGMEKNTEEESELIETDYIQKENIWSSLKRCISFEHIESGSEEQECLKIKICVKDDAHEKFANILNQLKTTIETIGIALQNDCVAIPLKMLCAFYNLNSFFGFSYDQIFSKFIHE